MILLLAVCCEFYINGDLMFETVDPARNIH